MQIFDFSFCVASLYFLLRCVVVCLSFVMDNNESDFVIELAINDWSTFLATPEVYRKSPSVSFDGLKWKFRVSREAPNPNKENAVDMVLEIGFKQPDISSSYISRAAILLTADPRDSIDHDWTKKKDVLVFGKFCCVWVRPILREQVLDDTVVLKLTISPTEKFRLSPPSSYTIRGLADHTDVAGMLEGNRYPTLYTANVDLYQLEKPIELLTFNPFMTTSFKPLKFCPPPHKIEHPEGIANFDNHLSLQDRQLRPDCEELVLLKSHYPRNEDGGLLAWINFIQISMDPKHHSVTNRWFKFSQPPRPAYDGLAFTKIGWVIWKCDQTSKGCNFRLRIWVLGEKEVQNVHDKCFDLGLASAMPKIVFTSNKIYALGVRDMATCALESNNEWITYSMVPDLYWDGRSKLLQWRDDRLVLLSDHCSSKRLLIFEINFVRSNGKEWFNVIPRFAIRDVPWDWNSYRYSMVITDSLLVLSGPMDIITVFFLQPLSLAASALLVLEKRRAQYMGMEWNNWNGDRISVGGLTEEELHELFGKVRHWRALNHYC